MKERERRLGSPASKRVGIRLLAIFSLVGGSACTLMMDADRFDREWTAADSDSGSDGFDAGPDSDRPTDASNLDGGDGGPTTGPNLVDCGATAPVDTNTNQQNCGWCGHNCRGQTCSDGMCQPEVLLTVTSAFRLAVDSQNLYYTSNATSGGGGAVGRYTLDGGARKDFADVRAYGIAIDQSNAYWATRAATGAIRKVPLANFDSTAVVEFVPASSVASGCQANAVAVDSTSIYWTAQTCKKIYKASKDNGGDAIELSTTIGNPSSIGVDQDRVYWATKDTGYDVGTVLLDGGGYKSLDSTGNIGMVLDNKNNYIYWANASGILFRANKDGSNKKQLYSSGGALNNIVVDGKDIYVAVQSPDALYVLQEGAQPKKLLSGPSSRLNKPEGLALDSLYVYVANQNSGEIMRVAR